MTLLVFFGWGSCAGIALGLTGAGGSLIAVPLLINVLHQSPKIAITTSLLSVLLSALYGSILRRKEIRWRSASLFAIMGAMGSPLGVYLHHHIDDKHLVLLFVILMITIGIHMIIKSIQNPQLSFAVRAATSTHTSQNPEHFKCQTSHNGRLVWTLRCFWIMAISGILTGILSGLFGVGGGFIIVPVLLTVTTFSISQSIATSLAIICTISLVSAIQLLEFHSLLQNPGAFYNITFALGSLSGMIIVQMTLKKMAGPKIQRIFGILILALAILQMAKAFL